MSLSSGINDMYYKHPALSVQLSNEALNTFALQLQWSSEVGRIKSGGEGPETEVLLIFYSVR